MCEKAQWLLLKFSAQGSAAERDGSAADASGQESGHVEPCRVVFGGWVYIL